MTPLQYIDKINTLYKTGNAREHSYRGDLQNLIMAILPDVLVTNEPARVACGAPDYVFDIMQGVSLNIFAKKKQ